MTSEQIREHNRRYRDYKTRWKNDWYAKKKKTPTEKLVAQGKCPHCTMVLTSEYHQPDQQLKTFGKVCVYWKPTIHIEFVQVHIHQENDSSLQNMLDTGNG